MHHSSSAMTRARVMVSGNGENGGGRERAGRRRPPYPPGECGSDELVRQGHRARARSLQRRATGKKTRICREPPA